ncbi:MAG: hypothetical protein ABW178_10415, partial [Pseudoxanthomonas sp.]
WLVVLDPALTCATPPLTSCTYQHPADAVIDTNGTQPTKPLPEDQSFENQESIGSSDRKKYRFYAVFAAQE